ncbi:MAG: hypothetical protein IJ466_09885 [Clostridia bacterium]|nr:hypothetical protein [Clostridia bacterium]
MRLRLNDSELAQLNAFLENCEDCERLSAREVVLDLYDIEPPVSMNFVFVKGGIGVDGAVELKYSEEEKGYYMGDRIEDAQRIRSALEEAGALPAK